MKNINRASNQPYDSKLSSEELLQNAFNENIISSEVWQLLKKQFANDPQSLNVVLNGFRELRTGELKGCSYDQLDKGGLLEELKERDCNSFKEKFKSRFGKEYKSN